MDNAIQNNGGYLQNIGSVTYSYSDHLLTLTSMVGRPYKERMFYVTITNHWVHYEYDEDGEIESLTTGTRSVRSDYVIVNLKQDERPDCRLDVFAGDAIYSYENDRVTGIVKNLPSIRASQWMQFCEDVNQIRRKAGLPEHEFAVVESGSPMTATLFNDLYDAVELLCPNNIIEKPAIMYLDSGYSADGEVVADFIWEIIECVRDCRDYYWDQ